MLDPFTGTGVWLRCALHAHTTNSDGELPPGELVRHYEAAGFDVLAITDHWVRTAQPPGDRLLVVPGTELDAALGRNGGYAHLLAFGIDADPEPPAEEFPGLPETAKWISASGGVPYIAHTYWSGLRQRARLGVGALPRAVRRSGPRRAPRRKLLQLDRAGDSGARRRPRDDRDSLLTRSERDASRRSGEGRARERRRERIHLPR